MDSSVLINCINHLVEQNSALMKKIASLEADRDTQPLNRGRSSAEDNTELRAELEFLKEELRRLKAEQENRDSRIFSALCTVLTEENVTVANELKMIKERIEGQEMAAEKMKNEQEYRDSQIMKLTEENTVMRLELESLKATFKREFVAKEDDFEQHSAEIQSLKELIEQNTNNYDRQFIQMGNLLTSRREEDDITNLRSRLDSIEASLKHLKNIKANSQLIKIPFENQEMQSEGKTNIINCVQLPQLDETIDLIQKFLNESLYGQWKYIFIVDSVLNSSGIIKEATTKSIYLGHDNLLFASFDPCHKEVFVTIRGAEKWIDRYEGPRVRCIYQIKELENLLRFCKRWKRVRPDGEIHCLYLLNEGSVFGLPNELVALFTTANSFKSEPNNIGINSVLAIRQHWPNYADFLLSDDGKAL